MVELNGRWMEIGEDLRTRQVELQLENEQLKAMMEGIQESLSELRKDEEGS